MTQISAGSYEISPDVISEEYMGETMLLNTRSLVYIRLDSQAGSLWKLLQEEQDLDQVYDRFKQQREEPVEQLDTFARQCISCLTRAKIIRLTT
jgi:hypothetical protein